MNRANMPASTWVTPERPFPLSVDNSINALDFVIHGEVDHTLAFQRALDYVTDNVHVSELYIPSGSYTLHRQDWFKNAWSNKQAGVQWYCLYVKGRSNFSIRMEPGAVLVSAMDVKRASFLVLDGCTDFEITDWNCVGTGISTASPLYDGAGLHIVDCDRFHVARPKAVDCHHNTVCFVSRDFSIRDGWTERSAVPFINGGVNGDFPVPDPALLTKMGTHIGAYACKNGTVDNNISYGSCEDGDMGCLGGGTLNMTFTNNRLYNYFREDEVEKKIVNIIGQGLFNDSGPIHTMIALNYLEGYYYGIDNKTETQACNISTNQIVRCQVSIACRRGEAMLPLNGATIHDNTISPNGGNGWALRMARAFDPDSRGFISTPVGIWFQDCQGAQVTDNTYANDYDKLLTVYSFVPIYISNTRTFNERGQAWTGSYLIDGNAYLAEQRMYDSGAAGLSNREFITVAGWPNLDADDPYAPVTNITVSNNTIDNNYTNTPSAYPFGMFRFLYCEQVTVINHQFNDIVVSGPVVNFVQCSGIKVKDMVWRYNRGLMSFAQCTDVSITDCSSWESTAGVDVPYYNFVDTQFVSFHDVKIRRVGNSLADGYPLAIAGTSDYFSINNNLFQSVNFNPSNPLPHPFYSGTLDTTGANPKNSINNNICIPASVNWPIY